ncbi:hypothetical protein V8C34DRAFT_294531 [Trichoderma compactum]
MVNGNALYISLFLIPFLRPLFGLELSTWPNDRPQSLKLPLIFFPFMFNANSFSRLLSACCPSALTLIIGPARGKLQPMARSQNSPCRGLFDVGKRVTE